MLDLSCSLFPLGDFKAAQVRIAGLSLRTPLIRLQAPGEIYLKLENLQPVGSFKIRCAANALIRRRKAIGDRVFTASAGNFAQGLAYVGRALGVQVTTYVPETAARSKIEALERLGADIVSISYPDWWAMLATPPQDPAFIHPVTDSDVIAGNGVIGLEILEDLPGVAEIIAPYGGGGLSVGIAAAVRAAGASARVVACESEAGAPLRAAFAADAPTAVAFAPGTFITGMGGPAVLDAMWPLAKRLIAGTALVSLEETARAVRLLVERHHVVAEGAGAVSVAAALRRDVDGPVVCIVSGGHLDPHHLTAILSGQTP